MNGISHHSLLAALAQLEPLQLLAVELLRQQAGSTQPVDKTAALQALRQLRDYEEQCGGISGQLEKLTPVPTQEEELVWTFPL